MGGLRFVFKTLSLLRTIIMLFIRSAPNYGFVRKNHQRKTRLRRLFILDQKTCKQISEHLFISKWSIGGGEFVGKPRNLVEEVSSRNITLLGCHEFDTDLHCARLRGRGKFHLKGVPDLLGRCGDDDVLKNFLGHRR
jgi:hypothetical protein